MPEAGFGSDRMWGLKELPFPEAVSWLPATPGWLLVAAVLLGLLTWLVFWRWRVRQRQRYRREALAQLDAMRAGDASLAELPVVLRATALAAFPREEVASLRGEAWVAWLNQRGANFEPEHAECLALLPYDPASARELQPEAASRLLGLSRDWVRRHRARI